MRILLINPPLVSLKGDILGSGIPSMPVGICYIASSLREKGIDAEIYDCFGESPATALPYGKKFVLWGLEPDRIIKQIILKKPDIIGITVHAGIYYPVVSDIIRAVKTALKNCVVVVGGAIVTTNYSDFINNGADYAIIGEGENNFYGLVKSLCSDRDVRNIDGIASKDLFIPQKNLIADLDAIPFPAIDKLPLENYWKLGYAHGPVRGKYAFLITSRGCPFNCAFCSSSAVWQRKWRSRSAKNVVDEIQHRTENFGITDFHIQDDNFAVNRGRAVGICREIISRNLKVTWSLAAGMKIETVDESLLLLMKKAGCVYISASPESGSGEVLKKMNKPFDFRHYDRILRLSDRIRMRGQACFVLGFPGETENDLKKTERYIKELAKKGLDEISIFLMTPLPGSESWSYDWGAVNLEDCLYTPVWRKDYSALEKHRVRYYLLFWAFKLFFHPVKIFRSFYNIIFRKFETKTEMTVFRFLRNWKKILRTK